MVLRPVHKGRIEMGFTLIELLVVIAIIGILVSMVFPAIHRARESARTNACLSNLHSIGQAVAAYIADEHGFFPPMAVLPTIEPAGSLRRAAPVVLAKYVSNQAEVFHCPSDRFLDPAAITQVIGGGLPGNQRSWYEWQQSSYGPMYGLSVEMEGGQWVLSRENRLSPLLESLAGHATFDRIPLLFDYESFHPVTDTSFASGRCILFADLRVDKGSNYTFQVSDVLH